MHTQFADIWQKLVSEQEFLSTNFPNQYRTLEECLMPFQESPEALGGLHVVSSNTDVVPCPFFDVYNNGGHEKMSPEEHASRFVPTTRTWSNSTFIAGLDDEIRSPMEKEELVDALFSEYEARVASSPEAHAMDYVHSYLEIVKQ